jgi:2-oxo-3-hexenedioate decarboxylase
LTHRIADALEGARADGQTIAPPSDADASFAMDDAYAVLEELTHRRLRARQRVRGHKIGLTYAPKWPELGIDRPFVAPIFDDGVRSDGRFQCSRLVAPRIEIEVVFRFEDAIPNGANVAAVARAIGEAALAFEVVDCHYPNWRCKPPDLVADYGAHSGLVTGEFRRITPDEVMSLDDLRVELECDGDAVTEGIASDVLGGPARAVAAMLATPHAHALPAGSLVSTGALTRGSHPVTAGQTWVARASGPVDFAPISMSLD